MGTYLSMPNTEKLSDSGKYMLKDVQDGKNLPYGFSEMQGWRKTMEDSHLASCNLERHYDVPVGTSLFAVFDGHAGREVSAFCAKHFVAEMVELESFKAGAYREALVETFHRMDDMLRDSRYRAEIQELKAVNRNQNGNGLSFMKVNAQDESEGEVDSDLSDGKEENESSETNKNEEEEKKNKDSDGVVLAIPDESENIDEEVVGDITKFEADLEKERETPKALRAESMNLNHLKPALKQLQKDGTTQELLATQKPEDKTTASAKQTQTPKTEKQDVHMQMKKAEEKGSISKNEAFELMMQVLKLQKTNTKGKNTDPANNTNNALEEPEKLEFDDEVMPSITDFATMAGCTAIVTLIVNNHLYTANAGDSRAVLCKNLKSFPLSFDHKPLNEKEKARIEAANGFVSEVGRVCGNLNLSRSIGDLKYKTNTTIPKSAQIITAEPDVIISEVTKEDLFFVMACDGVWDIMSNDTIVEFIRKELVSQAKELNLTNTSGKETPNGNVIGNGTSKEQKAVAKVKKGKSEEGLILERVVEKLFERCISEDPLRTQGLGGDNMTAIIILLKPLEEVLQIFTQKRLDE